MEALQERIVNKLSTIEQNLDVYNKFVNDPSTPEEDKKVVSFKIFYEMMAFSALKEFAEGVYIPGLGTQLIMATGLKGAADYVSIQDGKVLISPEYKVLLSQREDFLKNKKD